MNIQRIQVCVTHSMTFGASIGTGLFCEAGDKDGDGDLDMYSKTWSNPDKGPHT